MTAATILLTLLAILGCIQPAPTDQDQASRDIARSEAQAGNRVQW